MLYIWAAWRTPWLKWIALAVNIAMLFATPVHGAHYFVDVFAGITVAVAVIMATTRAVRRLVRMQWLRPLHRPEPGTVVSEAPR